MTTFNNNNNNRLLSFFKQQQGLGKNDFNYDFALCRLCVSKEDSWRAITPSAFISDFNEHSLLAAKFASCKNYQHILALGGEEGKIALQDITKKNLDPNINSIAGQQCHYNAIFDISWDPGQMRLVSASGDNTAKLWYVSESRLRFSRMFKGHSRSVKNVAFRKLDSAVFATGGRDGAILIWDTRVSYPIHQNPVVDNCIFNGHQNHSSTPISKRRGKIFRSRSILPASITGLVFQDDFSLISCGAGDRTIKVWDIRRNYTTYRGIPLPKHVFQHKDQSIFKSFTNLLVNESGTKLYANCMDNTIYCYNLTSYSSEPLKRYMGLKNNTFYVKSCLSPDENYLLSGSSDDKAYIWNVNDSLPLVTLNAHTVEVTSVAWSGIANTSIVTCDDDRHNIWRIGPEKIDENDKSNYYGFAKMYQKTNNVKLKNDIDDHIEVENNIKKSKKNNNMMDNDEEGLNDLKNTSDLKDNVIDSENNQENSLKYYSRTPLLELNPLNTSESEINGYSTDSLLLSKIEQKSQSEILSTSSINTTYSPTMNLPNYALNGEAPHLQVMSPKQKNKTKVDWLTAFRKRKLLESSNKTYQSSSSTLSSSSSSSTSFKTCDSKTENNNNLVSDKKMKQIPLKFKLKNADCDQTKQTK